MVVDFPSSRDLWHRLILRKSVRQQDQTHHWFGACSSRRRSPAPSGRNENERLGQWTFGVPLDWRNWGVDAL